MNYWVTGLAVAMLAAWPAVTVAQQYSTPEKAEKKVERAADKAENKAESTVDKAKGATKDSWITSKAK
ncbi:MAG TPA: hypothetical protein VGT40_22025, partial [Methylomirabilota bacterium]|nr:hypothetical protein [Methylomirabilota bacterium]